MQQQFAWNRTMSFYASVVKVKRHYEKRIQILRIFYM